MEVTLIRTLVLLTPLLLGSCFGRTHCKALAREECDVCPKDDVNTAVCKCLDSGKLVKDDFSEGMQAVFNIETDADAQQVCTQWDIQTSIPSEEEDAQCHQSLAYLKEYQADVCEDLGWSSD